MYIYFVEYKSKLPVSTSVTTVSRTMKYTHLFRNRSAIHLCYILLHQAVQSGYAALGIYDSTDIEFILYVCDYICYMLEA